MTLSAALNSAKSGLVTTQTQIAGTSDNVANALTEGYVARESMAVSQSYGGKAAGVTTDILRGPVNSRLLRDIRFAGAEAEAFDIRARMAAMVSAASGEADADVSLASGFAALKNAFQGLHDAPDSPSTQRGVLDAARALIDRFAAISSTIGEARAEADKTIGRAVEDANGLLEKVADLNDQIVQAQASGENAAVQLDERDRALTSLSKLIGIRTFQGEDGDVIVTTKEGITLLDGDPRRIDFSSVGTVPPGATLGAPLSGLSVDGTDITPGTAASQAVRSGVIAGAFLARDIDLPQNQAQVDELARQTLAFFQTADASVAALGPPATGLFTEIDAISGLPIRHDETVPADPVPGLAGRLAINAAVDPSVGGALARLRDGIQAPPGVSGDTTQIDAFLAGFSTQVAFSGTPGLSTQNTLEGYATELTSRHAENRVRLEGQVEARQVTLETLRSRHVSETGVNVDAESERLLVLEQAYAANAQVIATVNRMFEELLARLA